MKINFIFHAHSSELRPDGLSLITNAVNSLIENFDSDDYYITVVDNGSSNSDIFGFTDQIFPVIVNHIWIPDQRHAVTNAWNTGLQGSNGDIIVNSNDDVIFDPTINLFFSNMMAYPNVHHSIFAPVTLGIIDSRYQKSPKPTNKMVSVGGILGGWFFAFTKEFYQKYKYSDFCFFPDNKAFYEDMGNKEGMYPLANQENYFQYLQMMYNIEMVVVGWTYVEHIKKRDWTKLRGEIK